MRPISIKPMLILIPGVESRANRPDLTPPPRLLPSTLPASTLTYDCTAPPPVSSLPFYKSPGRVTSDAAGWVGTYPFLLSPFLSLDRFTLPLTSALSASRLTAKSKDQPALLLQEYPPAIRPLQPSHHTLLLLARNTLSASSNSPSSLRLCSGAAALNGSSRPPTMNSSILAASPASPIASAVPLDLHT